MCLCSCHESYWNSLWKYKKICYYSFLSHSPFLSQSDECIHLCMYAFLCLCIFLVSSPPHHSTDLLLLPGASGQPLSFSNNITGRSARPAQQEVRSSWLWNSLILKGFWFLLPAPLDTAFTFTLGPVNHGLRSLPHLPNIVSALSKRWQVGVEELSGPAILSEEGAHGGNTITGSKCAQKDGSLLEA